MAEMSAEEFSLLERTIERHKHNLAHYEEYSKRERNPLSRKNLEKRIEELDRQARDAVPPRLGDDGKITCKKCARVWRLTAQSLIQRNPDSVQCKCGETLHLWTGACFYTSELLKGLPEDEEPATSS